MRVDLATSGRQQLASTMLRWNGASWRTAVPPTASTAARDDVWLVTQGAFERSWSCGVPGRGMVVRWDGTAWRWLNLPLAKTWLPAVRADRGGGVWTAANPAHAQSYVLNFRTTRCRS
ncbi:hypothetical protein [Nonomuraea antimicrobica]|uniref:hypothetical protein n=1 Tax=Nonomuraea antimicrobica TaxID=561173 RepID=UPI0031EE6EC3